ncbi:sigma-70 family RNA polymerase sigma factor [Streptomyces sp. NPDC051639]|uniref:sigma-70 family RNA polymerase sigma factor n=1 Tax=unclassified Streptomyces TaxID=2593676 RepID=UPI002E35AEA6|nr:sigma-70 family RNA polymerase sigma factor [Streptomyces sp. NBC_01455]
MPHTSSDASSDALSAIPAGEGGVTAAPGRGGDFTTYATAAWPRLVRTAHLLTGDLQEAEDLVLATLARVRTRWRRIPRDDVAFYVRRALVEHHLGRTRRRRVTRLPAPFLPARPRRPAPGRAEAAAERDCFAGRAPAALATLTVLTARQRAVLVLRYGDGLSEAETAQLLGCAGGTVRTLARRGLEALRADPSFVLRHPVPGARP